MDKKDLNKPMLKTKIGAHKRKLIQLASALIYNANFKGFANGSIYKGQIKGVCVPGLNCYSCPGAIASCPLGTLQNSLGSIQYRIPMYIFGLLIMFGLFLGRLICGFLCPFGLIQELLYKIPAPKLKKNRITRKLTYIKYVILAVFVIILPVFWSIKDGIPVPAFCKYICPAGTLEGGLPLVLTNEKLYAMTGGLFFWKIAVLSVLVCSMPFVYRGFCRFLCPLGAIYSLFAKISIAGITVDKEKCSGCNRCVSSCKMDILFPGDRECIGCGECKAVCPHKAIAEKMAKTKKTENEI